ncbi:hypothetical protein ES703_38095 [subsurface metagenome]
MPVGDIGDVLHTYTFDATKGIYPAPFHIAGDLCAVAYAGPDDYGKAKSFNVSGAGQVTEPADNSLVFYEAATMHHRGPLRLDNVICTTFIIGGNVGKLEGIIVNEDGTLSQHANHLCPLLNSVTEWHQALLRPDGIVVCAHNHSAGYIFVSTALVGSDGQVGASPIENYQHTAYLSSYPSICHHKDDLFVVTNTDASQYLRARAVNVSAAGDVSASGASEVTITDYITSQHHTIKLGENTFVTVHRGTGGNGFVVVYTMDDAGNITVPTNYSYEFNTDACDTPFAIVLSENIFAIVYTTADNEGGIKTIQVDVDGAAVWTPKASHVFTGERMLWPQIVHRGGYVSVIAYQDDLNVGKLKTIELQTSEIVSGHTELCMGIGP